MLCWEKSPTFCVQGIDIAPSNIQLKYSNYVAFSHFHGCAVNNIGYIFTFTEIIFFTTSKKRKAFEKLFASCNHLIYFMTAEYTHDTVGHFLLLPVRLLRTSCILLLPLRLPTLPGSRFLPSLTGFCDDPAGMLLT